MKKIVRLTESDLVRLVKRVIKEQITPSAMREIFVTMNRECPTTINQLKNVITILGTGSDYNTFSKTATWNDFLNVLQKVKTTLKTEIPKKYPTGKTNPMFDKIQQLSSSQGIKPGDECVVKLQKLILSKAGTDDSLQTDTGKTEWADGIVGLATLDALCIGMIDFFSSVITKNPAVGTSPLTTTASDKYKSPNYKGIKDIQKTIDTKQYYDK